MSDIADRLLTVEEALNAAATVPAEHVRAMARKALAELPDPEALRECVAALEASLQRVSRLSCSLAIIDEKHTTDDDAKFCRQTRAAIAKLEEK